MEDSSILRSKDIIAIFADSLGIICVPSTNEPIPEREENSTQLRISTSIDSNFMDYTRSMFRIETDLGQKSEIVFGSTITLIHVPSELHVIGKRDPDENADENIIMYPIHLRKSLNGQDESAHKWIILPRYKLRSEGDPVRVNDFIILRNAQYKDLSLTSFIGPEGIEMEHLAAMGPIQDSYSKSGLKLMKVLSCSDMNTEDSSDASKKSEIEYIKGGDFLRLNHREFNGHIICRIDDENEIQSAISPLGRVCRKQTIIKDESHLVVARPYSMQKPRKQYDFATSYSSLGIWQILLVEPYSKHQLQGQVFQNAVVRFRHAISGQYLTIRPEHDNNDYYDIPPPPPEEIFEETLPQAVAPSKRRSLLLQSTKIAEFFSRQEEKSQENEKPPPPPPSTTPTLSTPSVMATVASFSNAVTNTARKPLTYRVDILSATASDLKQEKWISRTSPFLVITYGNLFQAKSLIDEHATERMAAWHFTQDWQHFQFTIPEANLQSGVLKIQLFQKNRFLSDTLIGQGTVSLASAKSDKERRVHTDTNIKLFNKRNVVIGDLKVSLLVERLSTETRSESNDNNDPTARIATGESIKKVINSHDEVDGKESKMNFLSPDSGFIENITENNNIKSWKVATSTAPIDGTLFRIVAMNKESGASHSAFGRSGGISYEDNIILENIVSKCYLKLSDILNTSTSSSGSEEKKWWEYQLDIPLSPKPLSPNVIVDSDVLQCSRVSKDEIQDALYISKYISLARAAIASFQLTPTANDLYLPLFRHMKTSLNTLVLWLLGQVDSDGALLSSGYSLYQNRRSAADGEEFDTMFGENDEDKMEDSDVDSDDDNDDAAKVTHERDPTNTKGIELQRVEKTKKKSVTFHDDSEAGLLERTKEVLSKIKESSAMSPWLGRAIGDNTIALPTVTSLDETVSIYLEEFQQKHSHMNSKILRRQVMVFDIKLIEHILHFLNVFFIMQRGISISQDDKLFDEYPQIPKLVRQCCASIHLVLTACVYANEMNALKVLSIRGTFVSLISQQILGWNPPIEMIMQIACQEDENAGNVNNRTANFQLESVLIRSITPNDLRQIVEQMHDMHLNNQPNANNILGLLTILCKSGKAKQYFQNILVQLLITCNEELLDFHNVTFANSNVSRDYECMLFKTECQNNNWNIQLLQDQYIIPAQETQNKQKIVKQLHEEANGLMNLFNTYNAMEVDDDILDVDESFCLLEDLGLGGPFLYDEIGRLMGGNLWGFFMWWCYRAMFYYPSSSVCHYQLSPIQAMNIIMENPQFAGNNNTSHKNGSVLHSARVLSLYKAEQLRLPIQRDAVIRSLRFQGIINSRVSGFMLYAKTPHEREFHIHSSYRHIQLQLGITSMEFFKLFGLKLHNEASGGGFESPTMLASDFRAMSKSINKPKAIQNQQRYLTTYSVWLPFTVILDESTSNENTMKDGGGGSHWLRLCFRLFLALCDDQNLYAQRMISIVLPVECILQQLQNTSLAYYDRALFCDLLRSIFVMNHFVFPTRNFPSAENTVPDTATAMESCNCIGYEEALYNPAFAIGKVFNVYSRTRYSNDHGYREGSQLRNELFDYIIQEIYSLELYSPDVTLMYYHQSLLFLFYQLLIHGFFNEEEYGFLDTNKLLEKRKAPKHSPYLAVLSPKVPTWMDRFLSSDATNPNNNPTKKASKKKFKSDLDHLEFFFVNKLCESYQVHAYGNYSVEATGGGSSSASGVPGTAAAGSGKGKSNNTRSKKKKSTDRKTLQGIEITMASYDGLYRNEQYTLLVQTIIQILSQFHSIHQMFRLQILWNEIYSNSLSSTYASYHQTPVMTSSSSTRMNSPDTFIVLQGMNKHDVQTFLDDLMIEKITDDSMTEGIFIGTLHQNIALRKQCYDLLTKRMSLSKDLYDRITTCMMCNVPIMTALASSSSPTNTSAVSTHGHSSKHVVHYEVRQSEFFNESHQSLVQRLVKSYCQRILTTTDVICQFTKIPATSIAVFNCYHVPILRFLMENIVSLLYDADYARFHSFAHQGENSGGVGSTASPAGTLPTGDTMNASLPPTGSSTNRQQATEWKMKQDQAKILHYYLFTGEIPCPIGEDDFFLLDLNALKTNEPQILKIFQLYKGQDHWWKALLQQQPSVYSLSTPEKSPSDPMGDSSPSTILTDEKKEELDYLLTVLRAYDVGNTTTQKLQKYWTVDSEQVLFITVQQIMQLLLPTMTQSSSSSNNMLNASLNMSSNNLDLLNARASIDIIPWPELPYYIQQYLTQFCEWLSKISKASSALCAYWYEQYFTNILLPYYPYDTNVQVLVHTILHQLPACNPNTGQEIPVDKYELEGLFEQVVTFHVMHEQQQHFPSYVATTTQYVLLLSLLRNRTHPSIMKFSRRYLLSKYCFIRDFIMSSNQELAAYWNTKQKFLPTEQKEIDSDEDSTDRNENRDVNASPEMKPLSHLQQVIVLQCIEITYASVVVCTPSIGTSVNAISPWTLSTETKGIYANWFPVELLMALIQTPQLSLITKSKVACIALHVYDIKDLFLESLVLHELRSLRTYYHMGTTILPSVTQPPISNTSATGRRSKLFGNTVLEDTMEISKPEEELIKDIPMLNILSFIIDGVFPIIMTRMMKSNILSIPLINQYVCNDIEQQIPYYFQHVAIGHNPATVYLAANTAYAAGDDSGDENDIDMTQNEHGTSDNNKNTSFFGKRETNLSALAIIKQLMNQVKLPFVNSTTKPTTWETDDSTTKQRVSPVDDADTKYYFPLECVTLMTIVLNVLTLSNGKLFAQLTYDDKTQLLFLLNGIQLFVSMRKEYIYDYGHQDTLDTIYVNHGKHYNQLFERIQEMKTGILLERIHHWYEQLLIQHYVSTSFKQYQELLVSKYQLVGGGRSESESKPSEDESFRDHTGNANSSLSESNVIAHLQNMNISSFDFMHYSSTKNAQYLVSKEAIESTMNIQMCLPIEYLKQSAVFRFIQNAIEHSKVFISSEGSYIFPELMAFAANNHDEEDANISKSTAILRSKSFAQRFVSYSNYTIWLYNHGRFITQLFHYFGSLTVPSATEYNLLHCLDLLYDNEIDEIRSSQRYSLSVKMAMIDEEKLRLSKIQSVFHQFGYMKVLLTVLGRMYVLNTIGKGSESGNATKHGASDAASYESPTEQYTWYFAPLIVKIGCNVIAWRNVAMQSSFVQRVLQSISTRKPPECLCLSAIQFLIRRCSVLVMATSTGSNSSVTTTKHVNMRREAFVHFHIWKDRMTATNSNSASLSVPMAAVVPLTVIDGAADLDPTMDMNTSDNEGNEILLRILRSSIQMYQFVGTLCNGDFLPAQYLLAGKLYGGGDGPVMNSSSSNASFMSQIPNKDQIDPKELLNLVEDLSGLATAILTRFQNTIVYINHPYFYEKFAPFIFTAKDNSKRKFFAWHNPQNNVMIITKFLFTLDIIFDHMMSLGCTHSMNSLSQIIVKLPMFLEFVGLMQLKVGVKMDSGSLWSGYRSRSVTWYGGDPVKFYQLYSKEMQIIHRKLMHTATVTTAVSNPVTFMNQSVKAMGAMSDKLDGKISSSTLSLKATSKISSTNKLPYINDSLYLDSVDSLRRWSKVLRKNLFRDTNKEDTGAATAGATTNKENKNHPSSPNRIPQQHQQQQQYSRNVWSKYYDFGKLFGVSYLYYIEVVRACESHALRFLLSLLEMLPDHQIAQQLTVYNDGILIQNLNSLCIQLSTIPAQYKDQLTSTIVSYISLIETMGIYTPSTDELLTQWDEDFQEMYALSPKSIYASVEIIGANQTLRRIYFPVPLFVNQYWQYPEVTKMKDSIVLINNRDSPEEKISDFLQNMNRLIVVMKRQEILKILLTPIVHMFFGGRTLFQSAKLSMMGGYFPSQRLLGLILTIGLNVYFVYYNTYPNALPPRTGDYISFQEWDARDTAVYIIQWVHLALMVAFTLRTILNSNAADAVEIDLFGDQEDEEGSGNEKKKGSKKNVIPTNRSVARILLAWFKGLINWIVKIPVMILLIIQSAGWQIILTAFSFSALRWTYWCYVPCLLDIIFQFDDMYFLFQAITRNYSRLGFTLLLAFLVLYFYSIVAYLFLGNQYDLNGFMDCEDPGSCFKLHLDYGLANSPTWQVASSVTPTYAPTFSPTTNTTTNHTSSTLATDDSMHFHHHEYIAPNFGFSFPFSFQLSYVLGTIYNLSYIILINLVLQAIISGLIIDTFSTMRDENERIIEDIQDKCFICSIKRDDFEALGIDYTMHIKEEHCMWHYAWFKVYLDFKDPLSFTSTENYAFNCMQDKTLFGKLMPVKRSLTFDKYNANNQQNDEENAKKEAEIQRLQGIIEKLQTQQQSMQQFLQQYLLQQQQQQQQQQQHQQQ